jgi:hypothetical protein
VKFSDTPLLAQSRRVRYPKELTANPEKLDDEGRLDYAFTNPACLAMSRNGRKPPGMADASCTSQ